MPGSYGDEQGTCEVFIGERGAPGEPQCGAPATLRYPAMGGGYMRLCAEHGAKHANYSEWWGGQVWRPSPMEQQKAGQ